MGDKAEFTNRLINEKSPYLLQHAHNPVDWYPWGDEAFKAAKALDKPIFLSIGYSSCHWCHVMEEESFRDAEVAEVLNTTFIPVKIDREELPHIDALYMEFAQAMIVGSAGWPLNVILTPELKPFFASTYLPKHTSKGLIGIIELSKKIGELWGGQERARLENQSEKIVEILKTQMPVSGVEMPEEERIQQTAEILFKVADPVYGGMRGAPKFPLGYQALFLLHYYLKTKDNRALFLVEKTLDMMHRGGIYDHLGGGFSRYSVDERWHIPHFEKMLYDNAILAVSYLEAWRVTGRELYKDISEEVLRYLLREMRSPEGGFYSAEDADSEGVEGLFYTWTPTEITNILGKEVSALFCDYYSISEEEALMEEELKGRLPLVIAEPLDEFAEHHGIDAEECEQILAKARQTLFDLRAKRPHPNKDDKIITAWNGLAINAFALAGFYFQNEEFIKAAVQCAEFIHTNLYSNGKLFRRYRDKQARFLGGLDDYAFVISGLLTLFEIGCGARWLHFAVELTNVLEKEFKAENGAFYTSDSTEDSLLIRKCHFSDGAEPSGNAIHAENLLRLYELTFDKKYLVQAEDIFKAAKRYIDAYPLGYCYHLKALQRYYDKKKAVVVVALNEQQDHRKEIVDVLTQKVLPHHSLLFRHAKDGMDAVAPDIATRFPVSNATTLSICHEGVCELPMTDKAAIFKAIESF